VKEQVAVDTIQDDRATPPEQSRTMASDAVAGPTRAGYGDFFSRVAHDLRSPLGIVMHVFQRIEADLEPSFSDEQRALMRLGGRSVRRLRDFVERMTLLSVLESDELEPSLQTVGLTELAKRCVATNQETEPRSGVSVSFEPPDDPCEVTGDPALITAIVAELLRNAVAHARKAVRVGLEPQAHAVTLFVEDDGAGMSDAARATLYARFIRRESRGGLGVGLSMARDLALAQAGEIRLEKSELPAGRPGTVGARFVLALPKPG
jgi:two-component system sensor histidine kinase TctE